MVLGGKCGHSHSKHQFERIEIRQMSSKTPSVFDLNASEKLQLVEDLWDDLAATPDAIPVHEWQIEELSRRKPNLLKNPASGLPGKR